MGGGGGRGGNVAGLCIVWCSPCEVNFVEKGGKNKYANVKRKRREMINEVSCEQSTSLCHLFLKREDVREAGHETNRASEQEGQHRRRGPFRPIRSTPLQCLDDYANDADMCSVYVAVTEQKGTKWHSKSFPVGSSTEKSTNEDDHRALRVLFVRFIRDKRQHRTVKVCQNRPWRLILPVRERTMRSTSQVKETKTGPSQ